eukprot:SAG31_NODE_6838_length_1874_cov_1.015775_3_plen_415_part_00
MRIQPYSVQPIRMPRTIDRHGADMIIARAAIGITSTAAVYSNSVAFTRFSVHPRCCTMPADGVQRASACCLPAAACSTGAPRTRYWRGERMSIYDGGGDGLGESLVSAPPAAVVLQSSTLTPPPAAAAVPLSTRSLDGSPINAVKALVEAKRTLGRQQMHPSLSCCAYMCCVVFCWFWPVVSILVGGDDIVGSIFFSIVWSLVMLVVALGGLAFFTPQLLGEHNSYTPSELKGWAGLCGFWCVLFFLLSIPLVDDAEDLFWAAPVQLLITMLVGGCAACCAVPACAKCGVEVPIEEPNIVQKRWGWFVCSSCYCMLWLLVLFSLIANDDDDVNDIEDGDIFAYSEEITCPTHEGLAQRYACMPALEQLGSLSNAEVPLPGGGKVVVFPFALNFTASECFCQEFGVRTMFMSGIP